MARDPPIFDFYHVPFLKASGKSTILQRYALSTTQILTYWLQKDYSDMARDPPIFDFYMFHFWRLPESLQFYEDMRYQPLRCWLTDFKKSTAIWQGIHQFLTFTMFHFWKVEKSTILWWMALLTTQMFTNWKSTNLHRYGKGSLYFLVSDTYLAKWL